MIHKLINSDQGGTKTRAAVDDLITKGVSKRNFGVSIFVDDLNDDIVRKGVACALNRMGVGKRQRRNRVV